MIRIIHNYSYTSNRAVCQEVVKEFKPYYKVKVPFNSAESFAEFCRINVENPDKIGVFAGYIYFVALLCIAPLKKISPENSYDIRNFGVF